MLWMVLLISISLSIDAAGAAMSYALRGIKIPVPAKTVICLLSLFYAGLSIWAGHWVQWLLPDGLTAWLGIVLMGGIGLWTLIKGIFKKEDNPPSMPPRKIQEPKTLIRWVIRSFGITVSIVRNPVLCDMDGSRHIDVREAMYLGLALSVDAMGVGLSASLNGLGTWLLPFAIALFQLLFLCVGERIGKHAAQRLHGRLLDVLPGILLLGITALRILSP